MSKLSVFMVVLSVVIVIVVGCALLTVGVQNTTVRLEEGVNEAEAGINVQEKRRVDLIYNLVDTVTQLANHEGQLMVDVAQARALASAGNINSASGVISAIAEAYPQIKADAGYLELMNELATTENMVKTARAHYNKKVRDYNQYIKQFPARLVLNILNYETKEREYTNYEAPQTAPQNIFDER